MNQKGPPSSRCKAPKKALNTKPPEAYILSPVRGPLNKPFKEPANRPYDYLLRLVYCLLDSGFRVVESFRVMAFRPYNLESALGCSLRASPNIETMTSVIATCCVTSTPERHPDKRMQAVFQALTNVKHFRSLKP